MSEDFEGHTIGNIGKMYKVGSLELLCPRCKQADTETVISVPIMAGLVYKEDDPGAVFIRTSADILDYQMHALIHKEGSI